MSARYSFNREAFRLFVKAQRTIRHSSLSMDQLAEIAGVTKSTIFRAEHCQPIARENFLALCLWMDVNPFAFLIDKRTGRGLADLPPVPASRETSGETKQPVQRVKRRAA